MKACNKCRCADVCAIKGEYDVEYTNAQNAYDPKGAAVRRGSADHRGYRSPCRDRCRGGGTDHH